MRQPMISTNRDVGIAFLAIAVAHAAAVLCVYHAPLIGDESVHYAQIARLAAGDFGIDRDHLTTIPGYHALVAVLM